MGEQIQVANGYADAEDAKWATHSDHPQRRHDDRREERCYDDRDHHHDDHDSHHDECWYILTHTDKSVSAWIPL